MKLKDLIQQAQQLIEAHPEFAEYEVFQMSCFDRPLTFETGGLYETEVYAVTDDNNEEIYCFMSDEDDATERAKEEFGIVGKRINAIMISGQ